jgi:hypothetical protein
LDLQTFELPPFSKVAELASDFSGMTLLPDQLPTAGVAVVSLFTNMVCFAFLCVFVLHTVIDY